MVGRDGIEPPTPGFSVRFHTLNHQVHPRSHVVIRTVAPPSSSAHHRWRRIVPNGMVQVRGKSSAWRAARVPSGRLWQQVDDRGQPRSSRELIENKPSTVAYGSYTRQALTRRDWH